MGGQLAHAADIDTDALAAKLHRLADGVGEGSVLVKSLDSQTAVRGADDNVTGSVELKFHAAESHRELLDMADAEVLGESDDTTVSFANDEV